ncbi:MAG: hypothetical protein KGI60_02710 [Patescibacteria group bacterium]|nr:hypothetical protein [Patescibacteria group bacterium]
MRFEKQKSSIERVVGVPPEEEEKILRSKAEVFDSQSFNDLKGKEREKTPEEAQIINLANQMTNEVRRRYGLDNFDVPPQNIHMIPEDKWPSGDKNTRGFYASMLQGVAIQDEHFSKMSMLSIAIHELLHFKSYNALQVVSEEKSGAHQPYRIGFQTFSRDGKEKYFTELNEAITEELSKRIMLSSRLDLYENPLFTDEINKTDKIYEKYPDVKAKNGTLLFTSDTLYAKAEIPADWKQIFQYLMGKRSPDITVAKYVYRKQRRMLNSLMDKIWNKHKDEFKDQEAVFDCFVKAYMTGNLLPIGRLIEDTFGKGSLRKIAELDMSEEQKKEKVK